MQLKAVALTDKLAARQAPDLSNDAIVQAVHKAYATGRVSLTWNDKDGIEKPTHIAKCFVQAILAQPSQQPAPDLSEMVNRFLGWKLPQNFNPDNGVSFDPPANPTFWPTGTNLLTSEQAKSMFEYCL